LIDFPEIPEKTGSSFLIRKTELISISSEKNKSLITNTVTRSMQLKQKEQIHSEKVRRKADTMKSHKGCNA